MKIKQIFDFKAYLLAECLWFGDSCRGNFEVLFYLCNALSESRLDSILHTEIQNLQSVGKISKSSIEYHIDANDDADDACDVENSDHMNWFIASDLISKNLTLDEIVIRCESNDEPRKLSDII